uniref:Choline monooxygenase, chloroplastic n=1 Tax=Emiliania huxleyi TaxID=2903 RepID=A0A7S3RN72_EMIHU
MEKLALPTNMLCVILRVCARRRFAQLEEERVFRSSWVAAAELCDVSKPGDVMPVNVGGASLLLANDGGTVRAFHNVCRHRGAKLVEEPCSKRRTILCPYHRWGYALDGRLIATPSFDDTADGRRIPEHIRQKFCTSHVKDFDKSRNGLFPVRTDSALGLIFVNVNGEAPPLSEWLGDLLPSLSEYESSFGVGTPGLVPYKRKQYDVPANWKLLVENYLEYYHLPAVHPELCNVSGVDEHRRHQGRGMYMCFATEPLSRGGTPIDPGRIPPFPTLRPRHQRMAYHVALFPNTFFSLYPDSLFRVILSPHGAGRTVEQATFLSHRAAFDAPGGEAVLEDMFQFWDLINTQDIDIVKNVHQGTSTPLYTGGRFSFRFEETLHRFQNMVIDKMLVHEPTRYRIPDGDVDYHDLLAAPDPLLPAAASG